MARRAGERKGVLTFRSCVLGIAFAWGTVGCTRVLGDFVVEEASGAAGSPLQDAGNPVPDTSEMRDAGLPDGACVSNAKDCSGRDQRVCDHGVWQRQATCPFVCTAGQCVGECTPGQIRCKAKIASTCQADGTWGNDTVCSFPCPDGKGDAGPTGCTAICISGSTRCSLTEPTTLETCGSNGVYGNPQVCSFVCSAAGPTAACGGTCKPDDRQCEGKQPKTCGADGEWVLGNLCPFVCEKGSCVGSCTNGAMQCNDRTVQVCTNETWMDVMTDGPATCPYVCRDGACAGECTPGTTQCLSNQVLQTCGSDGRFMPPLECPFLVCTNGACSGECRPGATRCSPTNADMVQACSQFGMWMDNAHCSFGCSTGRCNWFCTPGDKRCNASGAPEICDPAGNWVSNGTCSSGCLDGGVCAAGAAR